jgi:hypothetical protein
VKATSNGCVRSKRAAGDGAAIAACMRAHAFAISRGCVDAWLSQQSKHGNAQ